MSGELYFNKLEIGTREIVELICSKVIDGKVMITRNAGKFIIPIKIIKISKVRITLQFCLNVIEKHSKIIISKIIESGMV